MQRTRFRGDSPRKAQTEGDSAKRGIEEPQLHKDTHQKGPFTMNKTAFSELLNTNGSYIELLGPKGPSRMLTFGDAPNLARSRPNEPPRPSFPTNKQAIRAQIPASKPRGPPLSIALSLANPKPPYAPRTTNYYYVTNYLPTVLRTPPYPTGAIKSEPSSSSSSRIILRAH